MAPVAYSGTLPSKKKSELQEIALALRLSDLGTKDELQVRIKKHLDANQDALEDDPAFAGLFGRRRRSVQPQPAPAIPSGRFAPSSTNDPFAKPRSSAHRAPPADPTTPSSLPPLPPSAPASPAKSIIEHLPKAAEVKSAVVEQFKQQQILQNGNELLVALRAFLSNSRNIWSVTSVFELLYILSVTIPWKSLQIPINPRATRPSQYPIPPSASSKRPPSGRSPAMGHPHADPARPPRLPHLLQPRLRARCPCPSPAGSPPRAHRPAGPARPAHGGDRALAAQTAYPYAAVGARAGVVNLDVLGRTARRGGGKEPVREQRLRLMSVLDEHERERTPVRRALRAAGEEDGMRSE
ncbi:hypothetical protein BJ912DRAFT_1068971 [Pholiota molesta]|nr:hypothetical protein BJ912DRAFT_1068971 [Pholiota molesta]